MDRLLRTFVGLRCGAPVRRALHAAAAELARGERTLRLPAIEDLHTTVQFLGNTPRDDLARIGTALRDAAAPLPPIDVAYEGLGAFPDLARPRVLWAGLRDESAGGLARLVEVVGTALGALGYPPERRRFHAHVTLARVRGRPGPGLPAALESGARRAFGEETLSELKLILSDPAHRPYHYIDLTTVELGG